VRPAPNDMGDLAVAVRKSGNQELVGRADRLLMAGSGGPANGYYRPEAGIRLPADYIAAWIF
jgi:hypothetical protein